MSARHDLVALRQIGPVILPSLLMCDFGNLEREVRRLEEAGVGALHLDVMDGHFVPNLTYGMPLVEAVRRLTSLVVDVHLMIDDPVQYAPQFLAAGADRLIVHLETLPEPRPLLSELAASGAAVGLAINPPTPVSAVVEYLDLCDHVLVMSVMPGFGGQSFERVALDKMRELRAIAPPELLIECDGGVNEETIGDCAAAGGDLFVVGSAIFRHPDYKPRVAHLTQLAAASMTSR
ncbi:MAG: ribulose-phosphate 3-epimerase [Pirellulales bacterium]|nr:ribulose-phosphate 3-epimerase [Pirellulales bacterium]